MGGARGRKEEGEQGGRMDKERGGRERRGERMRCLGFKERKKRCLVF